MNYPVLLSCFFLTLLGKQCFVARAYTLRLDTPKQNQPFQAHQPIQKQIPQVKPESGPQEPVYKWIPVKTVTVECHRNHFKIIVKADLFDVGVPIEEADLRLGVNPNPGPSCTVTASSTEEFTIMAAHTDCGTNHWITEDSLIYVNLLVFSPKPSPYGVIRMEDIAVPVECHYGRRFELISNWLRPTWVPFTATRVVKDNLDFCLRLMTNDWQSERTSNLYSLGDHLNLEASVSLANHVRMRMFVVTCVATLTPDITSVPRYAFIDDDGCLTDSQVPGSNSTFFHRVHDNTLQIQLDAFRFQQQEWSEIYITCTLKAVPIMWGVPFMAKACSFNHGRWTSADGNDAICDQCHHQGRAPSSGHSGTDQQYRGYTKPRLASSSFPQKPRQPNAAPWSGGSQRTVTVGPLSVFPNTYRMGALAPPGVGEDIAPILSGDEGLFPPFDDEMGYFRILDLEDAEPAPIPRMPMQDPSVPATVTDHPEEGQDAIKLWRLALLPPYDFVSMSVTDDTPDKVDAKDWPVDGQVTPMTPAYEEDSITMETGRKDSGAASERAVGSRSLEMDENLKDTAINSSTVTQTNEGITKK